MASRRNRGAMPQREPPTLVDVLDRVLDKGVVVIASIGVSVMGLRLIDLDARIVVSSIDTYIARADDIEAVAYPRTAKPPPVVPAPVAVPGPPRRQALPDRTPSSPRAGARRRPALGPRIVRCADGCTFEPRAVRTTDGTLRCPYRRRPRCRVAPV